MTITPGLYRHFKGNLYRVAGEVIDATNGAGERLMVLYASAVDPTKTFVRDLAEFTSTVTWPDGVVRPRWVPEP